jgi:hypothetical protein
MTAQNNDKDYQDKLFQLMISSSEIYDQNIFKLATIISSASLAIIKFIQKFMMSVSCIFHGFYLYLL